MKNNKIKELFSEVKLNASQDNKKILSIVIKLKNILLKTTKIILRFCQSTLMKCTQKN